MKEINAQFIDKHDKQRNITCAVILVPPCVSLSKDTMLILYDTIMIPL